MKITISIEFLIFFILTFMFVGWIVWKKISNRRALKKYKPENDKGRLGEEKRRRDSQSAETAFGIPGLGELEERGVLPSTDVDVDGEASKGTRKTGRKFRNPFRRK